MRRRYKILLYIMIFMTSYAAISSLFEVASAIGEDGSNYIMLCISMGNGFGEWTAYFIGMIQLILIIQEIGRVATWGVFASRNRMCRLWIGTVTRVYAVDVVVRILAVLLVIGSRDYIHELQTGRIFIKYSQVLLGDFFLMMIISFIVCVIYKYRENL